jgi:hypothetical protein
VWLGGFGTGFAVVCLMLYRHPESFIWPLPGWRARATSECIEELVGTANTQTCPETSWGVTQYPDGSLTAWRQCNGDAYPKEGCELR